jgi:Tol biopolymer transport system component
MSVAPGTRIGPYEVLDLIGAGGMGEVYRARDTKLRREVALKVLPEAFAADPARRARLEREAHVLASLNHPHIAAIYGFEDGDTVTALALELVDGETLADRIARGPIAIDGALAAARQIAEALEAAHARGLVHRDLKPANIKLTRDGTVKVLDFGLARPVGPSDADGRADLPTVTLTTRTGVILGTPAFMSPEQVRGQALDKRADIWAFGCVLYEMLTSSPAFASGTTSDTLARVLEREPDWSRLPSETPDAIRRLLRRCLEKDPGLRLRDAGDALLEMHDALAGASEQDAAVGPAWNRSVLLAAVGSVALLTALVAALITWNVTAREPRAVGRLSYVLPDGQSFSIPARPLVSIAPDGASIVYAANSRLNLRTIAEWQAVPIRGTEGSPTTPFFSPDGQTLGYWDAAARELRKISIAGGTAISLAPAPSVYGASWTTDDDILYALEDGIWRVAADGGPPERLASITQDELAYGPRLLPGGKAVLFSVVNRGAMLGQSTAWDSAQVVVYSLETGETRSLGKGSDARVLPTGHLLYAVDTVLYAVPFDRSRLEVTGGPVPVVDGVQRMVRGSGGQGGGANYDVSQQGILVYVPRFLEQGEVPRRLVAVDRQGRAQPLIDDERDYWRPRISSDGARIAVEVLRGGAKTESWIVDLPRQTATPLATDGDSAYPVWAPDGQSVVYRSNRGGRRGLYRQAADGSGGPQLISNRDVTADDISREGVVVFHTVSSQDIGTLRLDDQSVSDFLSTDAREHMARFSPDGKWLAYTSNESGQDEVYVRPFPRTEGAARLISIGGGSGPVWAPDGGTLYYRGASGDLMAVSTTLSPQFTAGRPQALFRFAGLYRMSGTAAAFDVHPDGQRFIMVTEADTATTSAPRQQLNVVLNWYDELKRLVPVR